MTDIRTRSAVLQRHGSDGLELSERQLIEAITEQVMEILRPQNTVATPRSDSRITALPLPTAPISPPIGVCTGDYSQFPELAGRNVGAAPRVAASPVPSPAVTAEPLPLTGIITANQLQAAMDGAPDQVARLAADARLSPLASDLARQFPQRVLRVKGSGQRSAHTAQAPATWLWWADGPCSAVDDIVSQRGGTLLAASGSRSAGSLVQVVRDVSASIKSNRVAGAILFVSTAARAMCLANRCLAIRAVVGTCDGAVEQGINELGANVLVLEYPFVGARAMAAMIDRFTQQPPQPSAAVERLLAELHRCG